MCVIHYPHGRHRAIAEWSYRAPPPIPAKYEILAIPCALVLPTGTRQTWAKAWQHLTHYRVTSGEARRWAAGFDPQGARP